MPCHLDLIPDRATVVPLAEGISITQFRWIYENMTRIQDWAKCIQGDIASLATDLDASEAGLTGGVAVKAVTINVPFATTDYTDVVIDADVAP